jgi:transposase
MSRICGGCSRRWRAESVFSLGAATRVYVATGATDMRVGFDGLWGRIRDVLECDPASGHIFLFANGRRNRLRLVFFDGSGLWVCSKRMEGGRLHWPEPAEGEKRVQLSREQVALLIGGIDLAQTRERKWYRRAVGEESEGSGKT